MARTYHLLLPLFSIFLVRVDLTDFIPMKLTIEQLRVLDGDTVEILLGKRKYRVRLLYIDAPELGQKDRNQDLGLYSTKCLKKLITTPIELKIYGHDQYGRILGDFSGVNLSMIERGCAYIYEYSRFPTRRLRTRYIVAQIKSEERKRGLWEFNVLNPRIHRRNRHKF